MSSNPSSLFFPSFTLLSLLLSLSFSPLHTLISSTVSNAPIDTIKTRIQRASRVEGETAISRVVKVASEMFAQEGAAAFWKGITPRVARVAPGQAVVFTIYEKIKTYIEAVSKVKNQE